MNRQTIKHFRGEGGENNEITKMAVVKTASSHGKKWGGGTGRSWWEGIPKYVSGWLRNYKQIECLAVGSFHNLFFSGLPAFHFNPFPSHTGLIHTLTHSIRNSPRMRTWIDMRWFVFVSCITAAALVLPAGRGIFNLVLEEFLLPLKSLSTLFSTICADDGK